MNSRSLAGSDPETGVIYGSHDTTTDDLLYPTWLDLMECNICSVAQWLRFAYYDEATALANGCSLDRRRGAQVALLMANRKFAAVGGDAARLKAAILGGWGNGGSVRMREIDTGALMRLLPHLKAMQEIMGLPANTPTNLADPGIGSIGATPTLLSKEVTFSPTLPQNEIIGSIHRLWSDLEPVIKAAASRTNVPPWLITVIAAHEIKFSPYGKANTKRPYATGAAQITPLTFYDIFYIATTWGLVTPAFTAYMQQRMGSFWPRYKQLAMNRQAEPRPYPMAIKLLRDPELNLTMAGLHLACLIRFTSGAQPGLPVDLPRLVLGYNKGIAWTMTQIAGYMGKKQDFLIREVAKPTWVFPKAFTLSAPALRAIQSVPEARSYIADHLAPGGYFQQAAALGLMANNPSGQPVVIGG
ncbi:hypothetical protein J2I47_00880 [Fibrella sp. HMF5335]|uniref:Transglycosylase SLT domain-containing protein n=1 Tax=Fibrella rubiginis TaxID=2817060 RepID=A0A939GER5_9BACT|nr:hypothetical protein [Fibrella rubiginis]MBO0935088.1 hypothetical protein [Fibrella rubiginis]